MAGLVLRVCVVGRLDPELRHYARMTSWERTSTRPGEVRNWHASATPTPELSRDLRSRNLLLRRPSRWWFGIISRRLSAAQGFQRRCRGIPSNTANRRRAGRPDRSVFDLQSHEELHHIQLRGLPTRLAFAPDGKKLAVASFPGKQVEIHDLETGEEKSWDEPAGPYGVAWQPAGQLLAVWTNDFGIHLWNAQTGMEQTVLRGHQTPVVQAGFSPTGDRLWSWSWDGTTRLWDAWSGRELVRVSAPIRI